MRVAFDTQATLGRKTGIGRYASKLLAELRKLAPEDDFAPIDLGHEVVMRTDRRLHWQQWELPARARAIHPDLLHVTGFDPPLWKPCPTVCTVHDLISVLFPRNLPRISRWYWTRWMPWAISRADSIIVPSECSRRDVIRLLGIPDERISVAPEGVDEDFGDLSHEDVGACRDRYKLPDHFILFVGTIEPRKGIDTLVDALVELNRRCAHHLVIAGKRGWYWGPILRRIDESGIADRIHLLDYVPDGDVAAIYAAADVLAFPSRYEGFGLPALEAMACGTPVVCSNVSSLPEVVGQAALQVPPDDPRALAEAIGRVLADRHLAAKLSSEGRRRAAGFRWETTAKLTLEVYRKMDPRGRFRERAT